MYGGLLQAVASIYVPSCNNGLNKVRGREDEFSSRYFHRVNMVNGCTTRKKMFLLNIMRIANVHFSLPLSQSDPVMRGLCNSLTGVFELSAGIDYSSVTCGKTETTPVK